MTRRSIPLLVAAALSAAVPGQAHHSGAMFDQTKLVVLDGTLVTYKFQQPHSWLTITTNPKGGKPAERWDVEAASTATMRRMGITPDLIKSGAKLSLQIHPLRDGRKGGSLVAVIFNGKPYGSGYTANPYGTGRGDDGQGARVKDR